MPEKSRLKKSRNLIQEQPLNPNDARLQCQRS